MNINGTDATSAAVVGQVSLARLNLNDFRCYRTLRLDADARPVILTGPNGAGKTNILEAVSFLVPGRGLRGARLGDLARTETGGRTYRAWAVAADLETPAGRVSIGTGRADQGAGTREKRLVRIDGQQVRSQAMLADHLSAQWLTPQMDRLFVEGPSARRRFLDRLVFGFDPAHAGRVSAYEHALRERSRLLRQGQQDSGRTVDPEWLTALEATMAARGVAVAAARLQLASRLGEIAAQNDPGAFPGAAIAVSGDIEKWLGEGPALQAEDRFRAGLAAARRGDSENGAAGLGPHRSDLVVHHMGTGQAAALCSTGEQKALLIALILANARLQASERGSLPLLLLDEVAAHLDEVRRAALFQEILGLGIQAWMTGTDTALFEPLRTTAQFFGVENAAVTPYDF